MDIINEKFKNENVKVKARKLVTAFLGFYCSENKNILFRMDCYYSENGVYYLRKKGVIFMYITVKQAAEKWGISDRRVRILCAEGKVSGVTREGRNWMIPADARKPEDGRFKATESLLTAIEEEKRTGCQAPAD